MRVVSVERVGDGSLVRALVDNTPVSVGIPGVPAPTDEQILVALRPAVFRAPRALDLTTATKEQIESALRDLFAVWQQWKATLDEATRRGVAAVVLTALGARTDAAWAEYVATIQRWRQAQATPAQAAPPPNPPPDTVVPPMPPPPDTPVPTGP